MPAVGGKAKELLRSKESRPYFGWVEWTRDGKYILFPKLRPSKEDTQQFALWRIPAQGGKPQELKLVMSYIENLGIHPDGEHLVFASFGFTRKLPAIWVMENFLPTTVASK